MAVVSSCCEMLD